MNYTFAGAETLARLTDDIRKAVSKGFDPEMLAGAPFLDEFALVPQPAAGLTGIVTGHPRIADGHRCFSTLVFHIDTEQGVARTLNRWYRLGRPHGSERN
ncbi:DUF6634 family protein [Sinorhizobium meliloti]|uniref:DUF6634 family protein n=1 Tax=Rhizobium meliloti TaxID=382 RepID=UPI0030CCB78E